jgi:hypothetical protein
MKRGIITIAAGKKFAKQAKYLALSGMLHSPHIPRAVITDHKKYLSPFFDIVLDYKPELGAPFETKTLLHLYSPFEKTLYLDADSLIINNIDYYFDFLDNAPFLYYGIFRYDGIWYYDIERARKQTGAGWIPEFNRGMLLFSKSNPPGGVPVEEIFETAHNFMKNPGIFNIACFRKNMYPDEPFFALSFAKNNIKPFEDRGRFSRTLIGATNIKLNAVKGFARFKKYNSFVFPSVVHFCGSFGKLFYFIEKTRLFFYSHSPFYFIFSGIFVLLRKICKGK